jgi:hypothetical protein
VKKDEESESPLLFQSTAGGLASGPFTEYDDAHLDLRKRVYRLESVGCTL